MRNDKKITKCIIPCRLSYLNCFRPVSINDGPEKYSVSAIIPKNDTKTIYVIKEAIEQAKQEYISKWGDKIPDDFSLPLRDGDVEKGEEETYKGCYYINAYSNYPPQVVNQQVEPIKNESEIFSGCYGNISVNFFPYNKNNSCGISAGLGNIQLVKLGETLGDRATAKDEFAVITEENFLS